MPSEPILIVALASFFIGFLFGRATGSSGSLPKGRTRIQMQATLPADVETRMRSLIASGKKIEAIKELRQASGLGLKEAKDITDLLSNGGSLQEIISFGSSSTNINNSQSVRNSADAMGEVKTLLRNGKKIEALKVYREASGLGLKEAKDEIDRMAKELR